MQSINVILEMTVFWKTMLEFINTFVSFVNSGQNSTVSKNIS